MFNCCKKSFYHYVCIKCAGIFHKSCVSSDAIQLIGNQKIICSDCDCHPNDATQDNSVENLERTINDLSEDNLNKQYFIDKIKSDNQFILHEAVTREKELNDTISDYQRHIDDLKQKVKDMENELSMYAKSTADVTTQTSVVSDFVSVDTDIPMQLVISKNALDSIEATPNNKSVSTVTDLSIQQLEICSSRIPGSNKSTQVDFPQSPNSMVGLSMTNHIKDYRSSGLSLMDELVAIEGVTDNNSTKVKSMPRILLLCDDLGMGLREKLERLLGCHQIMSVIKPHATMKNLIESVDSLSQDFTVNDFLVIVGGQHDLSKGQFPSFKFINQKLRNCTSTNIIFTSVPYGCDSAINDTIYKYNCKLNDYLSRLNRITQGLVMYHEINNVKSKINKHLIVRGLAEVIDAKRTLNQRKSLIFINTVPKDSTTCNLSVNNCIPVSLNRGSKNIDDSQCVNNFLYPRLSQLSLM